MTAILTIHHVLQVRGCLVVHVAKKPECTKDAKLFCCEDHRMLKDLIVFDDGEDVLVRSNNGEDSIKYSQNNYHEQQLVIHLDPAFAELEGELEEEDREDEDLNDLCT